MKPGGHIWPALIRMARRKAIAADLVQRRRVAEEAKRQSFHSPPMTPEEVDRQYAAVVAERNG